MGFQDMDPELHKAVAKAGSNKRWAETEDRTKSTEPGRRAFMSRFANEEQKSAYFRYLAAVKRMKKLQAKAAG